MDGAKQAQKTLNTKIKENKTKFKDKVQANFNSNNSRQFWQGVNTMTGYKPAKKTISTDDPDALANDLNLFYARFDNKDFHKEQAEILNVLSQLEGDTLNISEEEVKKSFQNLNTRSACGPDNVSGLVLKKCSSSLSPVFAKLFQKSLDSGQVPVIWKTSSLVPVPKNRNPKEKNDYRPVALTSIAFKCLERIVLRQLLSESSPHHDPLQFAYSRNKGTEDAINTLLHYVYSHLETPKSYARLLFLDFSSAFNTIQPHLMARKLLDMNVNPRLIEWVFSFLVNRPQKVRLALGSNEVWSDEIVTNTGAPQGCVMSPALFTLYTSDCQLTDASQNVVQIKFSDDTSITGLIAEKKTVKDQAADSHTHDKDIESAYREAVEKMATWCTNNFLELNVKKTKELVIDFRRKPVPPQPLVINGEAVEIVEEFKYLGTILDNKLDWGANTTSLVKKGNQKMFFLRKLRAFNVSAGILRRFYQAAVESVVSYNCLCFHGNLREMDMNRLKKLTKTAASIVGGPVSDLRSIHEQRTLKRAKKILQDLNHPLHKVLAGPRSARDSSGRLCSMKARTERFRKSFVPSAIRKYNEDLK